MEKRDLIKDQIEQLGRVLGKILADLIGLKSSGQLEQGIEMSKRQFKSELDIDIDKLVALSKDELKICLVERKMVIGHFETLGEYLKEIGNRKMSYDKNKAKDYLTKSLELLDLEDEISKTMSFERQNLKSKIENMLQQCINH